MHIIALAWIYVVGLMAVMEPSVIAGIMTFCFYCLIPLSLIWYIANSKKRSKALESAQTSNTFPRQQQDSNKKVVKLTSKK
jgi:Ca2+/Na+ antiporter